jgi:putative glutamine amidotransferase
LGTVPPRPVIGLTTRRIVTDGRTIIATEQEYIEAVLRAGGLPRLLPALAGIPPEGALSGIDGLLLTGGGDVAPERYGQERSDRVGGVDEIRDDCEIDLVHAAIEQAVPLLGVCRGCQVLNVALGGTLLQHLPDVTTQPHLVAHPRGGIVHRVRFAPGSQLSAIAGRADRGVNSIHHQAIDTLAPPLEATGWADDGIVEGVEMPGRPVIGVQWHPESLTDPEDAAPFRWLVGQAGRRRDGEGPESPGAGVPDLVGEPSHRG